MAYVFHDCFAKYVWPQVITRNATARDFLDANAMLGRNTATDFPIAYSRLRDTNGLGQLAHTANFIDGYVERVHG